MDRQIIEEKLLAIYRDRLSNCAEDCIAYFHPEAVLKVEGLESEPGATCEDVLTALVCDWRFDSIDVHQIVVENDIAVSNYNLVVTNLNSDKTVELAVLDWVRFDREYLVRDFIQYMDTVKLIGAATA
ncbi:MAG: hypothetical protein AAF197_00150 [Pseudomonadota bacterium]